MPARQMKFKIRNAILIVVVLLLGTALLTTLLSVRSWYKPRIQINDVSPMTVILKKDREVIDQEQTDRAKTKAKLEALKNVNNEEILNVDDKITAKNFDKLKFVIQVVRNKIHHREQQTVPLNPKISLEIQDLLLKLDDEKYNQITLSTDLETTIDKYFAANTDLSLVTKNILIDELSKLNEIERKYFFENLSSIRTQQLQANEVKTALGKEFFDLIKTTDYETIFRRAFMIQKKLLDLGIVIGMPRAKIHENIRILYPSLTAQEELLVEKLIDVSTAANIQIDWSKVFELEMKAMSSVKSIKTTLKKGSLLAEKGKVVNARNYHFLKQLGLLRLGTDYNEIQNNLYLISILVIIISLVITLSSLKKYSINQILAIFLIPITVCLIIAPIAMWGVDKLPMIPLATVGMLLTIFYMPVMGSIAVTILCFFLTKTIDMNFWQVLPQYVGSLYGIYLTRRIHLREDLVNAGFKVALVQVFVFLLTVMVAMENFYVPTVMIVASFYAIGGIASGFFAIAVLPYLESGLKLITPFKLEELSNPNQPLLKLLKQEAPGTYQHALSVTRLSEEAGLVLGLNTELMRVGLLYHDIGKTHAPEYFIENTLGKPNPHTTLDDPTISAEIIIAHVAEGVKLARKYNLPEPVIDFIPMHQGTTITNFFYRKAIDRYGKENVNSDDYRYPGPKPNSKETGVAMMADSVEAALKSIKDIVDEEKAKDMIDKIVKARVNEGELRFTGLTRSDLKKVKDAFLRSWKAQNHDRVKYPD